MKQTLFIFLFLIFVAGIYASSTPSSESEESLLSLAENRDFEMDTSEIYVTSFGEDLKREMRRRGIPGGAIVVVKDNKVLYQAGFGVKVKGTNDSVDINTAFRLGSVSKGFASILAGTFVDDGLLNWNDYLVSHLPNFELNDSAQTQRIQIQHLLSHTTGLPRHAYTNLVEDGLTIDRIIPRFKNVELISAEGEQIAYQNAVYSVIEKVVESHSDTTFNGLLSERFFTELGMEESSSTYKEFVDNKNKAMPHLFHSRRKGLMPSSITKKYYNAISAGGINASISDMGNWLLMLTGNNPEIISEDVLESIFEPRATINNKRYSRYWGGVNSSDYALGWRVLNNGEQRVIYHGGYVNGYRSEIAFDRENKIGICILFNSSSGYALQIIPKFFNEFPLESDSLLPALNLDK